MSGRAGRAVQILLHVEDTPHRTALSFAIGVFIAFFPILGIHTGLALAIAFLFKLGRGPILVGAYINNPWTVAPLYMAGTLLGCSLLGMSTGGLEAINWRLHGWAFYHALFEGLRPYLWPFVLGNILLGIVSGVVGYVALRHLLIRRRAGS
jgi:hypothetical protein